MKMKTFAVILMVVFGSFALLACSDSSSSSSAVAPPTFTINMAGADGGADGGNGGDGGDFDLIMEVGSMGPLEIKSSGVADASFTATVGTPNLGDKPLVLSADTTLAVLDPAGAEPDAGTPYMLDSDGNVYVWDGTGDWGAQEDADGDSLEPVTGISVALGTTLTLELNYITHAVLELDYDLDNHGTITTEDLNPDERGSLAMYLASYHGNSAIDLSGTLDGQSGGDLEINPSLSFFNHGTINTSGYGSTIGGAGDGGNVGVYSDHYLENTGNITTSGGTASGAAGLTGGDAGEIDLGANGYAYNSGDLGASGGDGVTEGGDGNGVYLYVDSIGDVRNSGNIDTSGGDSTTYDAGDGDSVGLYAYGGGIFNSGNLTTKGGNTIDADSNGGDGGDVDLYTYYGVIEFDVDAYWPAGDVLFSGNVDTSGGTAVTTAGATGDGGDGGYFNIEANYENYPLGQRVALLGYVGSITTSGGDGNEGGDAGDLSVYCDYGLDEMTGNYLPGCNITNELDIVAKGGSVYATAVNIGEDGGEGGVIYIETDTYYGLGSPTFDLVANSGNIDVTGGDSLESDNTGNGEGGDVWIWGYNGVTNTGNITSVGGSDPGADGGTTGRGNHGKNILIFAQGPVTNSGALTAGGGDGEYRGGGADSITLFGISVNNSGALTANGGNADPLLPDSEGGDGELIELFAPNGVQDITQTGAVSNAGGTGETAGDDGDYLLGGQLM